MRLKITFLLFLGICILNLTCSSQSNSKFEQKDLADLKKNIQSNIDSAAYCLDQLIGHYSKGNIPDEVLSTNRKKLSRYYSSINIALREAPGVAKANQLSKSEYNQWISFMKTDVLYVKMAEIKRLGIDIITLPITNKYNLGQMFSDSTNNFSIGLPTYWVVNKDTSRNVVKGYGAILESDKTKSKNESVFAVNITPVIKGYPNEIVVIDHLIYLKKEMPNFSLVEQFNIEINSIPAIYFQYMGNVQGQPMRMYHIHFNSNGKKYGFIGSVSNDETKCTNFQELFIEISRTFSII